MSPKLSGFAREGRTIRPEDVTELHFNLMEVCGLLHDASVGRLGPEARSEEEELLRTRLRTTSTATKRRSLPSCGFPAATPIPFPSSCAKAILVSTARPRPAGK